MVFDDRGSSGELQPAFFVLINDACDKDTLLLGFERNITSNIIGQFAKFDRPEGFLVDLHRDAKAFDGLDKSYNDKLAFLVRLCSLGRVLGNKTAIVVDESHAFTHSILR